MSTTGDINPGLAKHLIRGFEENRFISQTKTTNIIDIASTKKNILIVYAHPDKDSLDGQLLDTAEATLAEYGHRVTVIDLHAKGFNPCGTDSVSDDQAALRQADILILQFPLTYWSYPAILKGWLEQVLEPGLGYTCEHDRPRKLDTLKNKRVLLSMTTPLSAGSYTNKGIAGDMDAILWPLQAIFDYNNMSVYPPAIHNAEEGKSQGEYQQEYQEKLKATIRQEPIRFIPFSCFGRDNQVSDKDLDEAAGLAGDGPSPYQSFGRCVRPGSMRISEGRWLGRKGKKKTRESWVKSPQEQGEGVQVNGVN